MSKKGVRTLTMMEQIEILRKKFAAIGVDFDQEMARALYQEGEYIMGESKAVFVPVKRGHLRSSGHVQKPHVDRGAITVVLGYGGPAVAYAVVQHERLDYKHTVGQAKYLERPALKRAAVMDKKIVQRLRKRLKAHAVA